MTKKTKKTQRLHLRIYISFAVFLFVFGTVFILNQKFQNEQIASSEPRQNLQLETFYPTRAPTPTPIILLPTPTPIPAPISSGGGLCPHDSGSKLSDPNVCACMGYKVDCQNDRCLHIINSNPFLGIKTCADWDQYGWCNPAIQARDGNGWYCIGKPVVYLYPEKDTLVNVSVKTEGKVVVSDPQIENGRGWTHVLAHPNGQLDYQGGTYRELFYESETTTLTPPTKGIVIKTSELKPRLQKYITLLGLTKADEQDEFLQWWIPKLQALNKPYIFFSILETQEKLRLDQVHISPKPDMFIQFIAYFKPLDKVENIDQLEITPAPERKGFTAVEWGGVIDP